MFNLNRFLTKINLTNRFISQAKIPVNMDHMVIKTKKQLKEEMNIKDEYQDITT